MTTARKSRKTYNRWMKFIRRAHLYAGLVLLPWVLFFGTSGFLFNHKSVFFGGRERVDRSFSAEAAREVHAFSGLNEAEAAQAIVSAINELSGEAVVELENPNAARLTGWLVFSGDSPEGGNECADGFDEWPFRSAHCASCGSGAVGSLF